MAITAASAAIGTTWVEFGTVSVPASTLGTISACIDEVGVKLNRGAISATSSPSDANVADWIQRAKQELMEDRAFDWRRRYVTMTCTSGTYRYGLPNDYAGGYLSIRDTSSDRRIPLVSRHQFDTLFPDISSYGNTGSSSGSRMACIKNKELWLGPAPGADVLELEYMRSGDDPADDIAYIPEIDRWRCVVFAIAESYEMLHMVDQAGYYRMKWERGLSKAKKADGKRRWSASGHRSRNVFQA